VRAEVTKALEAARVQKQIGHALDAAVTVAAPEELYAELAPFAEELRSILIVSSAGLVQAASALEGAFREHRDRGPEGPGRRAPGEKMRALLGACPIGRGDRGAPHDLRPLPGCPGPVGNGRSGMIAAKMKFLAVVAGGVLILDQATKAWFSSTWPWEPACRSFPVFSISPTSTTPGGPSGFWPR
jgi:hypothetical protein